MKKQKKKLKIKVNPLKVPNKTHLDALSRFPSNVYQDKRKKKPKYSFINTDE